MQATDFADGHDRAHRGRLDRPFVWSILGQGEMGAGASLWAPALLRGTLAVMREGVADLKAAGDRREVVLQGQLRNLVSPISVR
jgi:hypothetical protein